MKFTRLRLNGFKSFVDPTDLVIARGLTGVVGPNGCGKSNLLEALRWVMGENRPTAMRGGGNGGRDLCRGGDAARAEPCGGSASSSTMPNGWRRPSSTTRTCWRSRGGSRGTWALPTRSDRRRCARGTCRCCSPMRRRARIRRRWCGRAQISELINARPRSRRRVLEDAAGIGGLYQRRHEAELKLKSAEANLTARGRRGGAARGATGAARPAGESRRRATARSVRRCGRRRGRCFTCAGAKADGVRAEAEGDPARGRRGGQAGPRGRPETSAAAREAAEAALPPRREEEAVAAAVLQRLAVERDGLVEEEDARAGDARGAGRADRADGP